VTANEIRALFAKLNHALCEEGENGEIGIVGGAVMCLVYNARASTKDVDAIFRPSVTIRRLAERIAREEGLASDWLNDAAKAYMQEGFTREEVLSLSNLRVWAPDAKYLLAMKCLSARWDSYDQDDVRFLISHLGIKEKETVFKLIEGFYPKKIVPAKTQFFIEELMEGS
jgi:hypothetical protein